MSLCDLIPWKGSPAAPGPLGSELTVGLSEPGLRTLRQLSKPRGTLFPPGRSTEFTISRRYLSHLWKQAFFHKN